MVQQANIFQSSCFVVEPHWHFANIGRITLRIREIGCFFWKCVGRTGNNFTFAFVLYMNYTHELQVYKWINVHLVCVWCSAILFGWSLELHGLINPVEIPQNYPKLVPNLATGITQKEVVGKSRQSNLYMPYRVLMWWSSNTDWTVVLRNHLHALLSFPPPQVTNEPDMKQHSNKY